MLGVVRTDNASHRVHPAGAGSILPQQLPAPPVRGVPAEAGLVVHHGAVGADDIEAALLCGGEGLARVGRLVESHLADAAVCRFGDPFGGLLGQLEHGGVDLLAQRSEVLSAANGEVIGRVDVAMSVRPYLDAAAAAMPVPSAAVFKKARLPTFFSSMMLSFSEWDAVPVTDPRILHSIRAPHLRDKARKNNLRPGYLRISGCSRISRTPRISG